MRKSYDYIIIGAGSAGCVLANRLSAQDDVSVLVVEAGDQDKNFLYHWPAGFAKMSKGIGSWGWSTVPQKHMQGRVMWYTQAKVLGGGSTINAQLYTRGNAKDYECWKNDHGCAGWGYADVLPYFKRCEDNDRFSDAYHASGGPIGVSAPRATLPICDAFLRAAQDWGIPYNHDFNGASQDGIGFYQLTIRDGRRSSAASGYLRPALARASVELATATEIRRIVVAAGKASGIELAATGAKIEATREVIVAAGAIGSPRILQLSGIGPAEELTKAGVEVVHDLPGVGSNLQDHIDLCVLCECSGNHSYDSVLRLDRTVMAGLQYLLFKTGPVLSPLFETGGFWYADAKARSPDIQFHLGQGTGIEKGIFNLANPGVTLNSAHMRPRSRGTVRLASADLAAAPLIDPNYWAEPGDYDDSIRGLAIAREIMAGKELSSFIKREAYPGPAIKGKQELFDYACKIGKTDYHPVGTCKMGHDEDAVVDDALRLRGIDNLRVCDSSIMPTLISSNTNAATMMIAEKGADMILGRPPLEPAVLADS